MGSGSPILSRQSNEIYIPILIALGIAVICVIIFFIVKRISAIKKSPEYIEKEKKRETKYSDIKIFKTKFNLTDEEAMFLWNICEDCHPKNINYLVYDAVSLDDLFRKEYKNFKQKKVSEKIIANLFQLRYKIEQDLAQSKKLSSTTSFPVGTIFFYIDKSGEQFPLTLLQNEKTFIALEIPEFLASSKIKPEELKKARFMYRTTDGITYLFTARPIRYTTSAGHHCMITSHSTNLALQTQRQTKREVVKAECKFSSVKTENTKNKTTYIPSEKKHTAKLANVSAGGCCIYTQMPIKEQQLISIYYPDLLLNENTVGIIKKTRVMSKSGLYALHIEFIKTSLEVQNKIYAFVYKYEL